MHENSNAQDIPVAAVGLTKFDKLRAIPWSLAYEIANTFFVQLTFFGSAFVLFLNELGLKATEIGFLLAIFPFLGLLSLFVHPQVAHYGYKRTFLLSFGLRNLFTAGLLFTPLIVAGFSARTVLLYITIVTIAFATSRAIAMTALLPWQKEYISNDMRGKYSANSSIVVSLAGLIAVTAAGYIISRPLGLQRYSILFVLGILFGLISIYLAAHIPGGAAVTNGESSLLSQKTLLIPLQDRRFLRYLVSLSLITLTTAPVFAFLPIFMQDKVGLNPGSVVFLQTGALIGSVLSSYFWGWLADRYGSKPIALSGLLLISTLPVWWYLMPRQAPLSLPVALGIAFLQGIAGSGWGIGSGRMLFVNMVPAENKTSYLSQYNAWMGLMGGFSSILGGRLLDTFSGLQGLYLGMQIDSFTILFAVGLLGPLLGVLILRSIRAEREMGVGQFAGLFTHGNPLLAVNSLIRFYFAREELAVVAVTEMLGKSRSPLTVNELRESLNDPRFYVRFEALVSIAHHGSDENLVNALIEVLQGSDPALSMMSAWALGRIGDPAALPALRHALHTSPYRSVRAHVARSLGSLGDTGSIPMLLDMIRDEGDMGLKVAFASTLGKLKALPATPDLLDILYHDRYPSSRKEMGLSLARLIDAETDYINLHRSLLADPGTTLAQRVDHLRRVFKNRFPDQQDTLIRLAGIVERSARGELEAALREFSTALKSLPLQEFPSPCQQILSQAIVHMQEFGFDRAEYVILSILAVEKYLQEDPLNARLSLDPRRN